MANTLCGIVKAPYLPASFNGVPFDAVEVSSEHGRRGAEGEFPFGENTAYADLGRRIRTYTLQGKIQRDGFLGIAAALIAACELPGPGILVHPTRGILNAACKSLKVSDKVEEEQGVTYVDMEFVEGNLWPNGLSLIGSLLGLAFGALIGTARDDFTVRYQVRKTSTARRTHVKNVARATVGQISNEYQQAIVGTTSSNKYRILSDLQEVAIDPHLVESTEITDRAIALGTNAVAQEIGGQAKYDSMRRIVNFNSKSSKLTSPTDADTEEAVYTLARISGAVGMAQAATEVTYSRMDQVFTAMDTVDAVLLEEEIAARERCANMLQLELQRFRIEFKKTLYALAYSLPPLIDFNFYGGVHSLVAAYSIFNDAKRHRELEQGNSVNANGRMGPVVVAATFYG